MLRRLCAALILLTAAVPALANQPLQDDAITFSDGLDDIQVNLRISPESVEVGMPVELVITAVGEAARNARFPAPVETMGSFDVMSTTPLRSSDLGPNARGLRIVLSTYDTGNLELPVIEIKSEGRTIALGPATIEVQSLVGAEAGPNEHRDIREAIIVPIRQASWGWWAVGAVAFLVITAFMTWWWLARQPAPEPALPEDIQALRSLDELERANLPARGRVQQFFFDLTDIARTYIERRYQIQAPERTTEEFINETRRHHEMESEHAALLGRLLQAADMVKFGRDRPVAGECHRALEFVRQFVEESGSRATLFTEGPSTDAKDLVPTPVKERMAAMGIGLEGEPESIDGRVAR